MLMSVLKTMFNKFKIVNFYKKVVYLIHWKLTLSFLINKCLIFENLKKCFYYDIS